MKDGEEQGEEVGEGKGSRDLRESIRTEGERAGK